MTAIDHAITGAIIASYIHEPAIALPLALASHFVVDSVPHLSFNSHTSHLFTKVLTLDMYLCTLFLLAIIIFQPAYWLLIIGCALLAMSPDIMWLPQYVRQLKRQPNRPFNLIMRFHQKIQWGEFSRGYLVEISYFIVALTIFTISLTCRH